MSCCNNGGGNGLWCGCCPRPATQQLLYGYYTFMNPDGSGITGRRQVPQSWDVDTTPNKTYSRIPIETQQLSNGVASTTIFVPPPYPLAPNGQDTQSYSYTRFSLQPGKWIVDWYLNIEWFTYTYTDQSAFVNYPAFGIAIDQGTLTTILPDTIRKAYLIPAFGNPPVGGMGSYEGFSSGSGMLNVTSASDLYSLVWYKGVLNNATPPVPSNGALEFIPTNASLLYVPFQQIMIRFVRVSDV